MIKAVVFVVLAAWSVAAQTESGEGSETWDDGAAREPSSLIAPTERNYPGGRDEDELRVQNTVPEAPIRLDARTVQRKVYKEIYNQDLGESHEDSQED